MTDLKKSYAAFLISDNLGLLEGSLKDDDVPSHIVDQIASTIRGSASSSFEEPFLEKTFLEFLIEKERSEIERNRFFVRKMKWPEGSAFAVCLTHDVDNISRPSAHVMKIWKRFKLLDLIKGIFKASSLYNNVEEVAKKEKERNLTSSFYFLTLSYSLSEIKEMARRLGSEGWDIGLHGDFGTHDSIERMNDSLTKFSTELGFLPDGVREHYLKFDFEKTWEIMEKIGFNYDTTVGFTDRLGFKLGLATPFHPPDSEWKAMKLLEIPLTLMDTTLWGYLKRDEKSGLDDVHQMLKKIESVNGLFTLLWHQEAVKMKGGRLYWKLLDEFKGRDCFITNAAEIARWWRIRSIPLINDGGVITFRGSAPRGLQLLIKSRDQLKLQVLGGKMHQTSEGQMITVKEQDFKVKVD
jgi:hypothetical protein